MQASTSSAKSSCPTIDLTQKSGLTSALDLINNKSAFVLVCRPDRRNWNRFRRSVEFILCTGDQRIGWRYWLENWAAWDFYTIYHMAVKASDYEWAGGINEEKLEIAFRPSK